ncbi:hypothetical protein GCM10011490_27080 [Pseudoclavibacter endophyticus]|uniref:DNA starvation/stationary phase protection protein n=1 Tax=Pseudoclavibacter endophyticus TaxID=1778590 RepID=A0A6H9WM85_9MICO|nr:DNA starvation/stationary phase protection protein [Pseudoclavibacter endophyticus]KAB1646860.1 DNA starvation/stationary phase protection protein [Pseudoclavibacter endophyticus]GGA74942.1 hypothetical protein GCM10011490_27080 [Pseudoclavibacter endophyticus]
MTTQQTRTTNDAVTVEAIPAAQGDLSRPTAVANFLAPVVHDLVALAVNGKQAHWHVRGANFIGVHEFLDEVVEHAQAGADEVAERIVALGLPVDGRLGTVAAKTSTPELSDGFQKSDDTVREVVAQLDAALATLYRAVDGLEEVDQVSQDTAIAIAKQLDKDRWFLFSHIAE